MMFIKQMCEIYTVSEWFCHREILTKMMIVYSLYPPFSSMERNLHLTAFFFFTDFTIQMKYSQWFDMHCFYMIGIAF